MRGVRIPHELDGDDQFILGLSVTRLAALALGYSVPTPSSIFRYLARFRLSWLWAPRCWAPRSPG